MLDRVVLIDRDARLTSAWKEAFRDVTQVEIVRGDFFSVEADAMVSPANSFGIMDGGLDLAIRDALGAHVELRVQQRIIERHHGELPVGAADVVPTGDSRWPLLICAPTMRVPENASRTTNAYLAFRAALLAIRAYAERERVAVRSMICPGLCTGVGAMSPRRCAAQMRIAWRQVTSDPSTPPFRAIHQTHQALHSE